MNPGTPRGGAPRRGPANPPRQPAPPAMTAPLNLMGGAPPGPAPMAPPPVNPPPVNPPPAAAPTRRTRRTVDLTPAQHRALDIWQRDAADRLGLARVTGQEVLTALIDRLLSDPTLTTQITRAIASRR